MGDGELRASLRWAHRKSDAAEKGERFASCILRSSSLDVLLARAGGSEC